jgi:hypothetical protein
MTRAHLALAVIPVLFCLGCGGGGGGGGGGREEAIVGGWRIVAVVGADPDVDGHLELFTADAEFLRIEPDGSFAILNLTAPNLFQNVRLGTVVASAGHLEFDGQAYDYDVTLGTLTVSSADVQFTATLDPTTPLVDEWVVPVVELSARVSLDPTLDDVTDLAWDGQGFWMGGEDDDVLREIDLTTGQVTDTTPCNAGVDGLTWDGFDFWIGSGGVTVLELDDSGNTGTESPTMGAWNFGLAFDGAALWVYSNNEQTLYKWTPGNLALDSSLPLPDANAFGAALEHADGFLYLACDDLIIQVIPEPFQVVRTYRCPGFVVLVGIVFDGTDFYVLGDASAPGASDPIYQVVRVSLP